MTSTTPTEPEALAALEPILSAIAESGKIEAVDWHNIRRAICDGEAAMRERAAQIADAEMVDTFEDSPEVDCICNSVVREIAKSIRAISTPAARMLAGEGDADKALVERLQSATRDELIDIAVTLNRGVRHAKRSKLAHPPAAEPVGLRELLDRAELAWQRFFYPDADIFTGPIGVKLPSVDLEVADCLRLVLAAMGRHVVTPSKGIPAVKPLRDAQVKTVAEKLAAFTGAPYEDWRHFTVEAGHIIDRLSALATPARTDDAGVGGEKRHTVDIIREWLMSSDHPVSQWERDFAAALDSALSPAPDRGEGEA